MARRTVIRPSAFVEVYTRPCSVPYLASNYGSLVRSHFPNAHIVADRFHVIRIIHHHFLACWRDLDGVGSKNRGLLSLMRRHRHHLRADQQLIGGKNSTVNFNGLAPGLVGIY